jgi:hypothetical protein
VTSFSTFGANEALAEVNAYRAKRGLRPFVEDPGLTAAAMATADYRARIHLFGHTKGGAGDFRFLPAGVKADAAGCAAYPPRDGWLSCCADENYTYAGAAWTMGSDGKRYMHLFVRGGPSAHHSTGNAGFFTTAPRRFFRR